MGTFTDPRDGKTYKTVTIGKQTWMAENLNYEASGSKVYDNNPANGQKYGRLYDWETAKMACPPGWHLPSLVEWLEFVNFAGGEEIAGNKLKATNGWNSDNGQSGNGTDEYGFNALPGGGCFARGTKFVAIGRQGGWWTATMSNSGSSYTQTMGFNNTAVRKDVGFNPVGSDYLRSHLYSVRCVKD